MKTQNELSKTLTISLPANLYHDLEQAALEQDRSKNYLIKKAVGYYLEEITKKYNSPSKVQKLSKKNLQKK